MNSQRRLDSIERKNHEANSNDPTIGQPGYGWHYFVDARKGRAVVISPSGDYCYTHGKGPTLVLKATGAG